MSVLEKLTGESWDAVWTVSPTDLRYHPLKQVTVGEGGAMEYYDPRGAAIIARQQLSPVYHRNGAAYAVTRECLLEQRTIKGARTAAVILNEPMVSIDTLGDFAIAERHLQDG
jgi:CMP-N-acetylneuraminic acid synthetase